PNVTGVQTCSLPLGERLGMIRDRDVFISHLARRLPPFLPPPPPARLPPVRFLCPPHFAPLNQPMQPPLPRRPHFSLTLPPVPPQTPRRRDLFESWDGA